MARILVIDDEEPTRSVLRAILEPAGYDVVDASDGEEGIARYRQEPADLVITDILMPKKQGLETIQELRRDFPDVKIIAISASGLDDYLSLARDQGALRTFAKPFDRGELMTAVEELLGA